MDRNCDEWQYTNVLGLLDPEGGDTVLLWNFVGCLLVGMASDFSIFES